MRFEGTLAQWDDDRGFGFIQPTEGGQKLFVHISAFARDGQRPQLNEKLSFEVTLGQGGKKQAVAIQRPRAGASPANHHRRAPQMARSSKSSSGWGSKLVALALGGEVRCDPCIGFHAKALVRLGATPEEFHDMLGVAVYMGGGPSLMYAAHALEAFEEFSARTA